METPDTRVASTDLARVLARSGAVNPPVHRASTIVHATCQEMSEARSRRAEPGYAIYGRDGLPVHDELEAAITALGSGDRTKVVGSGLAALNIALLAFLSSGSHLLIQASAYPPLRIFAERLLSRFGVEVTPFAASEPISPKLRPNTGAVLVENPSSNSFEMVDLPAVAQAARSRSVPVVVDTTWSGGILYDAIGLGADVAVQSLSKYVGGHSDLIGGAITCTDRHWRNIHETSLIYASALAPDDAYLCLRGLRTLPLRLRRHGDTAMHVIDWLSRRPEVAAMLSPAAPGNPGEEIWRRDFAGHSGLFGVAFVDGFPAAAFADALKRFHIGQGWGGFESLVLPVSLSASALAPHLRQMPTLRFHVGLEDASALIDDLDSAFAAVESQLSNV